MKTLITLTLTAAEGGDNGVKIPADGIAIFDPKNGQVNADGDLVSGDRIKATVTDGVLLDAEGNDGVWLEPGQYWASVASVTSRVTKYVEVPESDEPILLTSLFELEAVPAWRLTEGVVDEVKQARDEAVAAVEGIEDDIEQTVTDLLLSGEIELPPGERGPEGPEGPAGQDGAPGSDGASAYQVAVSAGFAGTEPEWLESLVGPEGPAGRDGIDGQDGEEGPQGPPGADGTDGSEGPRGPQGIQGEPGADGSDGADGAPGADGKSAYQIALDEGFVGDEAEFLDSLVGPEGPQGQDGVADKRTVIPSAMQSDFVEMGKSRSPYGRMTIQQLPDGSVEVVCHADDSMGHRVSYQITPSNRYRLVGEIRDHGQEYASYDPPVNDGESAIEVFPSDVRLDEQTVTSGTWTKTTTWYTIQVGATWESVVTTTQPDTVLFMSAFCDNRGGIWEVTAVEDSSLSATVSTYAASSGTRPGLRLFSVPEPGTYTIRGTFAGEDPANPLSSGSARGWLARPDVGYYHIRGSVEVEGYSVLSPQASNKNWAFRGQHVDGGGEEFMPWHGTPVETILQAPVFYAGASVLDAIPEDPVEVESLSMVQRIRCHNTSAPADELIEVRTVDTILPDGSYRAEGRITALRDFISTDQMYTGMLPFNPGVLDKVVLSSRLEVAAPPGSQPSTKIGDDGLYSTSAAIVGGDPDVAAAVRWNNPDETRRMSVNANLGNGSFTPMFIEHRNDSLAKVYPRFGYLDGEVIKAGTVWRFSVDYWLGRSPGIRDLIS